MQELREISQFKDLFLQHQQELGKLVCLEPEVAASWQRSKKMHIDPEMQELHYVLKHFFLH
ncbi:MAG TPA: hypothetical protein GX523_03870 [Desulfitobacterium dehalogenans]|uniref:Uncharacterized protein n=1 Tax=Desulfitobacterium dehalogenans TaxID=36854 RepID=A0A7C6Z315_9FIRM|nr:hypothetical protein [Desulfitobacterium dehalogenans]